MKKNTRNYYILILSFSIVLFSIGNFINTTGNITQNDPPGGYGGTFIDSSTADAQMFNPVISSDSASSNIESLIFEGLLTYDKDMDIIPNLAYSWDISENKLDYTFYLREDVKWHDGEQFTVEDVIFTWDRILDPETDTTRASMFDFLDLENVPFEKFDDFTVIFHNKISVSPSIVLNALNFKIIPQHVFLNHLGNDGVPFTEDDCRDSEGVYTFNDDPKNRDPVGTGCMIFFEWEIDDHITLIRNSIANGGPGYWKEHDAYLDRYLLRVISDVNVQLLALQAGEIDKMDLSSTSQDDIETLRVDPRINVFSAPTFTSDHIAFQCDPSKGEVNDYEERDFDKYPNFFAGFEWQTEENPEITGHLVRQALNYGLDKEGLIDYAYPQGSRNLGPMYLAQTEWYNCGVEPYDYDLTKANELLDEAGYGATHDDSLRKKLNFTISFNQGNLRREKTCKFACDQWKNLGIYAKIENLEWVGCFREDEREFDAMSAGWTGGGGTPDLSGVWSSRNILPGGQPIGINLDGKWVWSGYPHQGGLNYMSYWNPAVDVLMDEARVEENQNIRKIYSDQIQEKIVDDSPYIWLLAHVNMIAVDTDFCGFVMDSVAGFWPEPIGFRGIYNCNSIPYPYTISEEQYTGTETTDQTSLFEEKLLSRIKNLPLFDIGLIAFILFELRVLLKVLKVIFFN